MGNINAELVSYPFKSVIFHQIKCGENRKNTRWRLQDSRSQNRQKTFPVVQKVEGYLLDANDMLLICLTRTKT